MKLLHLQKQKLEHKTKRRISPLPRFAVWGAYLTLLCLMWHWSYLILSQSTDDPIHMNPILVTKMSKYMDEKDAEIQAALAYVHSFSSLGKKLSFFHIPKTAGTAVEEAAGQRGLAWGSCAFPHRPKRNICHYPQENGGQHSKDWPQHYGWWHLPPFLFPIVQPSSALSAQPNDQSTNKRKRRATTARHDNSVVVPLLLVNPYANSELFGIIRNPLDRMLSEFHYICTLKILSWRPDQCDRSRLDDATYMNQWIRNKLRQNNKEKSLHHTSNYYLQDNGHFTSQYDFVFGPHQVRMLDYVLRIEDLNDSFPRLVKAFFTADPELTTATNPPYLQLQQRNALGATKRSDQITTNVVLDDETIQEIHQLYRQDFIIGRYESKERTS